MATNWHASHALVRCSGRVEQHDGTTWAPRGTAFFVSDRELLTCAHVVRPGRETRVVWLSAIGRCELPVAFLRYPDRDPVDPYPLPDVATLRVREDTKLPPHGVAHLGSEDAGDDLWAVGYTDEYAKRQMLGHPCRFRNVGPAEASDAEPEGGVWRITGDRVKGGMSGAPLLDLNTGKVVGIVKRTQDDVRGFGAWFTPMNCVKAHIREIFETNQALYRDPRQDHDVAQQLWGPAVDHSVKPLRDNPDVRRAIAETLGLEALVGDDEQQARRVSRELFLTSIDALIKCVNILAPRVGVPTALALFDAAAVCTTYEGEQWISGGSAAELEAQVERLARDSSSTGLVLRLDTAEPGMCEPYVRRSNRNDHWGEPFRLGPFSHEIDEVSGLPADLELELRLRLLDRSRYRDFPELRNASLDAQARARWDLARHGVADALREQCVIALLPDQMQLDQVIVERLTSYCPILFLAATADRGTPTLRAIATYVGLDPDVDDRRVGKALDRYYSGRAGLRDRSGTGM